MMTKNTDEFVTDHNPCCSQSRAARERLQQRGITARIIEYLKTPPTEVELRDVIKKLGTKSEALLRKGEQVINAKFAGRNLSDDECIVAMVENPTLIERPIVIRGERAVVGRPLERINELL